MIKLIKLIIKTMAVNRIKIPWLLVNMCQNGCIIKYKINLIKYICLKIFI